jgi:uncharacterized protein (TIGR02145 family)
MDYQKFISLLFILVLLIGCERNDQTPKDVMDIDGNSYRTISIGSQVWMAENLRTTKYSNGLPIDLVSDDMIWTGLTTGAYCWYENAEENKGVYGALYNWYAVETGNLCPEGWHVPTEDDWKQLEIELGLTIEEIDSWGWRGVNQGSKLAGNADLWQNGELKSDAEFSLSGFNALPSGHRSQSGYFQIAGRNAAFWSSTEESDGNAYDRRLYFDSSQIGRDFFDKKSGFSVRCIKD